MWFAQKKRHNPGVYTALELLLMIDDLANLAIMAAVDVAANKAAKRHLAVRIICAIVGLVFFVLLAGVILLTVIHS
jgi:small neutral amino acid transporter SnatA (MarC family)